MLLGAGKFHRRAPVHDCRCDHGIASLPTPARRPPLLSVQQHQYVLRCTLPLPAKLQSSVRPRRRHDRCGKLPGENLQVRPAPLAPSDTSAHAALTESRQPSDASEEMSSETIYDGLISQSHQWLPCSTTLRQMRGTTNRALMNAGGGNHGISQSAAGAVGGGSAL
jgi:hypothetical protein